MAIQAMVQMMTADNIRTFVVRLIRYADMSVLEHGGL